MIAAATARLKRPFLAGVEFFKAKQTGNIPFGLTRSIQRGILRSSHRGVPMRKHPIDLALYAELIWNLKPRTIIEIGSAEGGSALWFADLLTTYQLEGYVVSVDIKQPSLRDDRIVFLQGNAEQLDRAYLSLDKYPHPWLISEDASHYAQTSSAVLRYFAPLMQAGEYIVVEDGNVTDMGNAHRREGGPLRAIREFLWVNHDFAIDRSYCDRFGHNVTACPDGFLKKVH